MSVGVAGTGHAPTTADLSFGPLPRALYRDLLRSGCLTLVGPPRAGKRALLGVLIEIWQAAGGLVRDLDLREPAGRDRYPRDLEGACRAGLLQALGPADAGEVPAARFQSELAEDFRWLHRPGPDREGLPLALRDLIAEAVAHLPERLAGSRSSEIDLPPPHLVTLELPDGPGPLVCGRPRLLRRALENLLQNACEAVFEHCRRGGRQPMPGDVSVRLSAERRHAVIEVCSASPPTDPRPPRSARPAPAGRGSNASARRAWRIGRGQRYPKTT